MNKTCIVVADAQIARFYGIEAVDSPRGKTKLVERAVLTGNTDLKELGKSVSGRVRTETNTSRQAGPVHPIGAQRERHRLELTRRFAGEIAGHAAGIVSSWPRGTLVLVAEPGLLGLLREPLRAALHRGIDLKELAKGYTHLTASEVHEHLALNRLLSAPRRTAQ